MAKIPSPQYPKLTVQPKDPFYLGHRDGVMLFTDRSDSQVIPVYRYDIASGQWSRYQGKYADKLHNSYRVPPVIAEGMPRMGESQTSFSSLSKSMV